MPVLTVSINETPEELQRRNGDQIKVVTQGPGVKFYTAQWPQKNPGTVMIEHGKYKFSIPYVLSFQGMEDSRAPQEGLVQYEIYAGVTAPDLIEHDEARKQIFSLLQRIRQAGWTPFIDRDDPRLRGKERLEYVVSHSSVSSLDPNYEPTLSEWMQLQDLSRWTFYADHAYLSVSFKREESLQDPAKRSAYLLTYTLMSENEHFRAYVTPKDRDRWKELVPAAIKDLLKQREQNEKDWRAKGAKIDEVYVDPPAPKF